MANNSQIDEISLGIRVEDRNSAAKINAVADAINKLQKSLASLKSVSEQMAKLNSLFSSIKIPKGNITSRTKLKAPALKKIDVDEQIKDTSKISSVNIEQSGNKNYQMASSFNDVNASVKAFGLTLEEIQSSYSKVSEQTNILNDGTQQTVQVYEQVQGGMKRTVRVVNGVVKAQKEVAVETKKSTGAFSKFVKSVGRIAFYRAIRTALKEIVQAAKEGLQNIREVSPELNKTMNSLSQSGTTLKNTFAMALVPILQTIQPLITSLADSLANVVNQFSEAQSVLKGEDDYIKILTSDTKEYQEQLEKTSKAQGKLLSFDTFTTQQVKNNYTGTKKEKVTMSLSEAKQYGEKLENFKSTLKDIADIISLIVVSVKDIGKFIVNEINFESTVQNLLDGVRALSDVLKGIAQLLNGDIQLGIEGIIKGLLNIIGVTAKMIIMLNPLTWIIKGLGYILGFDTSFIDSFADSVKGVFSANSGSVRNGGGRFAKGGTFEAGDYFLANENGNTELIASSNNGGGAVMNLDQWASISYSSFYRALSDYDAAQNGRGGELDINSLGRTIAGNTGFVNEMNRRNSTLNLI